MRNAVMCCIGFCLLWSSSITHAELIDQRDPQYQKAIAHFTNALTALNTAGRELREADAHRQLPGIDIVGLLAEIQRVQDTLQLVLTPEQTRYETQQLKPDSEFFSPVKLKDVIR
jgi:hypothetical protein